MVPVEIFVSVLDEGVDVWRPVLATPVSDSIYRICEQPYDRNAETWALEPGALVTCELVGMDGGSVLAATRLAEPQG